QIVDPIGAAVARVGAHRRREGGVVAVVGGPVGARERRRLEAAVVGGGLVPVVAPGPARTLGPARRLLPLRLGRQPPAPPVTVRGRVVEGDANHRLARGREPPPGARKWPPPRRARAPPR